MTPELTFAHAKRISVRGLSIVTDNGKFRLACGFGHRLGGRFGRGLGGRFGRGLGGRFGRDITVIIIVASLVCRTFSGAAGDVLGLGVIKARETISTLIVVVTVALAFTKGVSVGGLSIVCFVHKRRVASELCCSKREREECAS